MKISIKLMWMAWLLSISFSAFGQANSIPIIKKGERVPDLELLIHIGNTTHKKKISDFKGKLLLLDFWGVNCPSCITTLPKMQALQHEFGEKIQIVVVSEDNEEKIENLYEKFRDKPAARQWIEAGRSMPFVKGDTILTRMFPHYGIPTHVWIDNGQLFYTMTYDMTTNSENIQAVLDGKSPKLAECIMKDINKTDPLAWLQDADHPSSSYSFLTKYIEFGRSTNCFSDFYVDSVSGKATGISCINYPILDLYKEAYRNCFKGYILIPDYFILLETNDLRRFNPPRVDPFWGYDNTYCYGFKVSPRSHDEIGEIMRRDLDKYFNIESSIQRRIVKCFILKQLRGDKLFTKGAKAQHMTIIDDTLIKIDISNLKEKMLYSHVRTFINSKKEYRFTPVVDELNFKDNFDIQLLVRGGSDKARLSSLREELQRYGLDLVEGYRELEVLVIHDRNNDGQARGDH